MKMVCLYPIEYTRWFGSAYFMLALASLTGAIYAANTRQHQRYGFQFALIFFISILYVMGFAVMCVKADRGRQGIFIWDYVSAIPLIVVIITFAVCFAYVLLLWYLLIKHIKSMLTPKSLQEGLDKLPDGVYFGTKDNIPLLINRKMQEIMNELFVKGTQVPELLNYEENKKTIRDNCRIWRSDFNLYVKLTDGTVWNIFDKDIKVKRGHKAIMIKEILAYDITKRYERNLELEERNKRLSLINEKLRQYSLNLDSITRQKEILNAKIRLHDDVGRCLLALRTYLAAGKNTESIDRNHLEDLWKSTIAILNNESDGLNGEEDTGRMAIMSKAADSVGVTLIINGDIKDYMEEMVTAAIHECLTNTVKHADGSVLTVNIYNNEKVWSAEITNNGKPPSDIIVETGGLHNLRSMIELKGGTMEVISIPKFKLIISNKK